MGDLVANRSSSTGDNAGGRAGHRFRGQSVHSVSLTQRETLQKIPKSTLKLYEIHKILPTIFSRWPSLRARFRLLLRLLFPERLRFLEFFLPPNSISMNNDIENLQRIFIRKYDVFHQNGGSSGAASRPFFSQKTNVFDHYHIQISRIVIFTTDWPSTQPIRNRCKPGNTLFLIFLFLLVV